MKSLKAAAAAMIVLGACAPLSLAQLANVPPSTIESRAINTSQRSQIDAFVRTLMDDVGGDDPIDRLDALNALVRPLESDYVSPDFRRVYTEALAPVFATLDAEDDANAALASLRLSGELGTPEAVNRIADAFTHSDAGVRVFAAGRAGRVLASVSRSGPAVDESRLRALVDLLGDTATTTGDAELKGACVRALGAGAALPSRDFRSLRGRCIGLMCSVSAHALRDSSDSTLHDTAATALQSAATATAALSKVGEDATTDATKGAVELSAQMIAKVLKRVVSGAIPPAGSRLLDTTLLQTGESLLYFAQREHAEITGGSAARVQQTALAATLESGEDRDFRNAAALLIGPGSPVVTTFGFADDEFVN